MVPFRLPALAVLAAAVVCFHGCAAAPVDNRVPLAGAEAADSKLVRRHYYESMVRLMAEGGKRAKSAFKWATSPIKSTGGGGAAGTTVKKAGEGAAVVKNVVDGDGFRMLAEKAYKSTEAVTNAKFARPLDELAENVQLAKDDLAEAIRAGSSKNNIKRLSAFVKQAELDFLEVKNAPKLSTLEATMRADKATLNSFLKLDSDLGQLRSASKQMTVHVDNLNAAMKALEDGRKVQGTNLKRLASEVELQQKTMADFLAAERTRIIRMRDIERKMTELTGKAPPPPTV